MKRDIIITTLELFIIRVGCVLGINCNLRNEIYVENYCYKLVSLNQFLELNSNNYVEEVIIDKSVNVTQFINFYEKVLSSLINLYLNNQLILNKYEFTILKNPSLYKNVWTQLIEAYSNEVKFTNLNIFINLYTRNNEQYYIENQVNDKELPSIIVNEDQDVDGIVKNCIFGKKENDSHVKFYYEACDKKNPFMCVKPYKLNSIESVNISVLDCSAYNKYLPGGNWYYCSNYTFLFNNNFQSTIPQKCCMYNANLLKTHNDALKFCSQFNSYLFSLNLVYYNEIDLNYVDYLNRNYDLKNVPKYSKFWTWCSRNSNSYSCYETNENSDKVKNKFHNFGYSIYKQTYSKTIDYKPKDLVLNAALIDYSNSNVSLNFSNLISLYKSIFELKKSEAPITPQKIESVFLNLNFLNSSALLVRRLSSDAKPIKINTSKYYDEECYSYVEDSKNSIDYISIPFISSCYQFKLTTLEDTGHTIGTNESFKLNDSNEFEFIDNIMNIFDLKPVQSGIISNASVSFVVRLLNETILKLNLTLKNLNRNQIGNNNWLSKFKEKISSRSGYSLVLENITKISFQLVLTCFDTFKSIRSLINDCFNKNGNMCFFRCPTKCHENDGIIWQSKLPFKYLNYSNICLAASHFGIENDTGSFRAVTSIIENNHGEKLEIYRNNLTANIWPLDSVLISNQLPKPFEFFEFHVQNHFNSNKWNSFNDENQNENQIYLLINPVNIIKTIGSVLNFYVYTDNSNNYSFQFQEIYPSKSYFNYSLPIEYKTQSFKSYEIYNFKVNIDKFKLINRYYELIVKSSNSSYLPIKFPINFATAELLHFPITHRILIDLQKFNVSHFLSLNLPNKQKAIKKCTWHLMNINTFISCQSSIKLELKQHENYTNLRKQNLIFYPHFESEAEFKLFTRVSFYEKNENLTCQHDGIYLEKSKKCLCLPGFRGIHCENACDKPYEFGENCEYECLNSNCSGYLVCTSEQIGCSCFSGYSGYNCVQKCSSKDNKWGPNCQFDCETCLSTNSSCDIYTGKCICKDKLISGVNCDECVDGYYGEDCKLKCPVKNCLKCDKLSGKCNSCERNTICLNENCTECVLNCPSECLNFSCQGSQNDFCSKNCLAHEECEIMCKNVNCSYSLTTRKKLVTTKSTQNITTSRTNTSISTTTLAFNYSSSFVMTTIRVTKKEDKNSTIFYITNSWLIMLIVTLATLFLYNFFIERRIHRNTTRNYKYVDLKLNTKIPKSNKKFFNFNHIINS